LAGHDVMLTPAQAAFVAAHVPGFDVETWNVSLAGLAGSERRFVRIGSPDGATSMVLVIWDSQDNDWDRFTGIQAEVGPFVLFLPVIHAVDSRHGLILEEDLGSMTLHAFASSHRKEIDKVEEACRSALDALIAWQAIPPAASRHLAARSMDLDMFLWESDYFAQHCVTEYFGCEKLLDTAWHDERRRLAEELAAMPKVCIHRDFQSENIMVTPRGIRFVDFQGARLGPAGYDCASLLFDPYNDLLEEGLRNRLFAYYDSRSGHMVDANHFALCAISRLMQALGAYANLSLHKGKERYRRYVPVALGRLTGVLDKVEEFRRLRQIVDTCLRG
jgi:N-acetylmuramate 1-kinase